uniref:LAGLIDADG endonuclease n=1 Tax=Monilinia laxa TaxID=61186 RepID=A0A7L8EZ00_MONLA|nr:hypothetical protein [Monilinia laxa]QOE17394.1 hypothetical protein [Monilinia laxa]
MFIAFLTLNLNMLEILSYLEVIPELSWSFNDTLNASSGTKYDPVRDINLDSTHSGSSGGGGGIGSACQDTDTTHLANFLEVYKDNTVRDARLERHYPSYDPSTELGRANRTWAHVRGEHPEFINTQQYNSKSSFIDNNLLNNIRSLNKNYPTTMPSWVSNNPRGIDGGHH